MGLCRLCLNDSDHCIEIFGDEGRKHLVSQILSEYFWFQIVENDAISTVVCRKCWFNTSTFQAFHHSIKLAQQSLFKQSNYIYGGDSKSTMFTGVAIVNDVSAASTLHSLNDANIMALHTQHGGGEQQHIELAGTSNTPHCDHHVVAALDGLVAAADAVPSTSGCGSGTLDMFATIRDGNVQQQVHAENKHGLSCKLEPQDASEMLAESEAIHNGEEDVGEHPDASTASTAQCNNKRAVRRRPKSASKPRRAKSLAAKSTKMKNDPDGDNQNDDGADEEEEEEDDDDEYSVGGRANVDGEYDEDDTDDDEDDNTADGFDEDEDDEDDGDDDEDDDDDDDDDEDTEDNEDLPILRNKSVTRKSRKKKKKPRASKQTRAEEDARIRSVCSIYCSLCMMSFETFGDLTKHYRLAHDRKGFVMCCDRKMTTRSRLLEHIETHMNPDAFQCTVCDVRFGGRFPLKKHMDTHMSDAEKPFACEQCPNRYTKPILLARHRFNIHSAEEDKKYPCEVCDKKYLSAAKLAEHVKRSHDFVPEICDYCGKEFKSIYNLNVHRSEVHMGHEVPRMQCNICGTWLREKYLKKHLKRHNAEVETCTVCGKTLQNKNSLGNHMRNVHGNRMHQCAVCGKTFSKPLSLREHMALHTGQDLYTCPYCPKTFKSGANMHSHRKKFHFEDWSKDRGKRLVTSNYL